MLDTYEYLIKKIVRKVPSHLKDDCYQAACLGLVKAMKKKDDVTFFKSYAYRCMQSEVIKELASLNHSAFSLDHNTFLLLCKYKKEKSHGRDPNDIAVSNGRLKSLTKLSRVKAYSYVEDNFAHGEDWCKGWERD